MDKLELVLVFFGQCGHESARSRHSSIEIHDGSNYEFREDFGNTTAGEASNLREPVDPGLQAEHRKFSEHIGDPVV